MKNLFVLVLLIFGMSLSAQPVRVLTPALSDWLLTNPQDIQDTTYYGVFLVETAPDSLFQDFEIVYGNSGEAPRITPLHSKGTKDQLIRFANRQIRQADDEILFLYHEYASKLDQKAYWQAVKNQIE